MTANEYLQVFSVWLWQFAAVAGGLLILALVLYVLSNLLSSAVVGGMERGKNWAIVAHYFANRKAIQKFTKEWQNWGRLRTELVDKTWQVRRLLNERAELLTNLSVVRAQLADSDDNLSAVKEELRRANQKQTDDFLEKEALSLANERLNEIVQRDFLENEALRQRCQSLENMGVLAKHLIADAEILRREGVIREPLGEAYAAACRVKTSAPLWLQHWERLKARAATVEPASITEDSDTAMAHEATAEDLEQERGE